MSGYWVLSKARSNSSSWWAVNVVLLLRCFLFNGIPGSLSQSDPELVLPASGQERTFRRWLLTERICSIEKLKNRRDYLHDFSQNFRYFKTRTIISPSSSSSFSFFLLFLIVVREEEKKKRKREGGIKNYYSAVIGTFQ